MKETTVIFKFSYLGHELVIHSDEWVTYRDQSYWLWEVPTDMRNAIDVAYRRQLVTNRPQ